jgi:hypothetical protein
MNKEKKDIFRLSKLHIFGVMLLAIAGPALAVDQTTIDQVVNVAKIGCLLGNEFTFDAKANGDITFFKLNPGVGAGVHTNIKEDPGARGIIDQQLKVIASQQIRDCLKPYVQKLAELILGQASGNQITSIDATSALDLGDCPDDVDTSLWGNDPDRTYRCSCPPTQLEDFPRIIGTSVYEAGSKLCLSAIHASVLKRGQPGKILVRLVPAPPVFKSTMQNGLHSQLDATSGGKYGYVVSGSQ